MVPDKEIAVEDKLSLTAQESICSAASHSIYEYRRRLNELVLQGSALSSTDSFYRRLGHVPYPFDPTQALKIDSVKNAPDKTSSNSINFELLLLTTNHLGVTK